METTPLEFIAPYAPPHPSTTTVSSPQLSTTSREKHDHLPSSIAWHGVQLVGPEINDAVITVADHLVALSIRRGSRVVFETDDSGRTALVILALAHIGAKILLVNDVAKLAQLPHRGEEFEVVLVLRQRNEHSPPVSYDLRPLFTDIERPRTKLTGRSQAPDLTPWIESHHALGIFTSGTTTGQPQVVWKSGQQLQENALATAKALGYERDDIFLPLLPLSGQYGSSVLLIAMVLGAGIAFCRRTKITETIRTIERHGVTAVDGPPLVYQHLTDHLEKSPKDLQRIETVRLFGVGGEHLTNTLQTRFHAATQRRLTDGYGLTQLGNVAFSVGDEPKALTTIDTFEAVIVDYNRDPVAVGEIGRLLIRRRAAPIATSDTQNDLCDTGDLARRHAEGFEVLGREGMINRNGTLLPLAWIEAQVSRAGITGYAMPSQSRGTARYTLIIHDPVHEPIPVWHRRIAQVLLPDHLPDTVFTIGELPIDPSGKVSRHRLQNLANGLISSPHEWSSTIDQLRDIALASRSELISLIDDVSDLETATADFEALMNLLDHAAAEIAYYSAPGSHPVDVFMARNSLLESFALYCLLPSLWSEHILVRPARGTKAILASLLARFAPATRNRVKLLDVQQREFVTRIAARPSVVIFTGLRANAEEVASKLTSDHLFLFFGRGINPVVITENASLDRAAEDTVAARLFNGGQDCLAPDLLLLHESIAERFLDRVNEAVAARMARNHGRLTPITKPGNLHSAITYLLDHSSGLRSGGSVDYANRTLSPAVVKVGGTAVTTPVEHYAPIFSYTTFGHLREVDELLNSPYFRENGLGVTLYGYDRPRAKDLAEHYLVALNQSLSDAVTPLEAFGGHGAESGFVIHRGVKTIGPINITETVTRHLPMQEGGRKP